MIKSSFGIWGTRELSLQTTLHLSWHSIWAGSGGRFGLGKCHLPASFASLSCYLSILAPGPFEWPCQLFEKNVTVPKRSALVFN